jgi:hypothetical protein
MSGQLVGEVIAAQPNLKAKGISDRAFHALVAIAEKCHYQTRQGSVRWDHIRAGLYGSSKRTARRAVKELTDAGILRVARIGWTNQHTGRAPVYEITDVLTALVSATAMATSSKLDAVTAVDTSSKLDVAKSEVGCGQIGVGCGHPGVLLDGSIDGPIDGGTRESSAKPKPPPKILEEEPNPHCPKHRHITGWVEEKCRDCGTAKKNHEAWIEAAQLAARQARAERTAAIAACPLCDDDGYIEGEPDENGNDTVTPCNHQEVA